MVSFNGVLELIRCFFYDNKMLKIKIVNGKYGVWLFEYFLSSFDLRVWIVIVNMIIVVRVKLVIF